MKDKQNKGIGRYRDRPGYFMGGMIGGAILGALVNKIQGKDVKRGAITGGITGGLGSWAAGKFAPTGSGAKANWLQKLLYKPVSQAAKMQGGKWDLLPGLGKWAEPVLGAGLGAGAAYLAGDPDWERERRKDWKRQQLREQMARNRSFYPNWYTNPWTGDEMMNTGGMINARPGYPGGGSATLEYTDPDLYTPTGEGRGPSSSPILQIPLGPEGSFADEFEDLDMASGPSAGSEAFQVYENYLMNNNLTKEQLPFEIFIEMWRETAARGGYKTRPQYRHAGSVINDEEEMTRSQIAEAMLTKSQRGQMRQDEGFGYDVGIDDETYNVNLLNKIEDPNVRERLMKAIIMSARLKQPEGRLEQDTIDRTAEEFMMSGIGAGSEDRYNRQMSMVEDKLANLTSNPMAFRAEGGIADLDMTGGGASFGPGTGTSDDIPAMLSDGEFVVTANAVKNLGGGDRMEGARKMYSMMNQLDPSSQTPAEMSGVGYA